MARASEATLSTTSTSTKHQGVLGTSAGEGGFLWWCAGLSCSCGRARQGVGTAGKGSSDNSDPQICHRKHPPSRQPRDRPVLLTAIQGPIVWCGDTPVLQLPDDRRERGKRKPRLGPMPASQPQRLHQSEPRDSQQARGVPGQRDGRSAASTVCHETPQIEQIQRKTRVRDKTPQNAPRTRPDVEKEDQKAELKKNQTRRRYVEKTSIFFQTTGRHPPGARRETTEVKTRKC